MPRAEPARGVERLAERDVVDALGQDRLEVGASARWRSRHSGQPGAPNASARCTSAPVRTGSRADPLALLTRRHCVSGGRWDRVGLGPSSDVPWRGRRGQSRAAVTGRPVRPVLVAEPCPLRRVLAAVLVALLLGARPRRPCRSRPRSTAKVVIVVGPVGDHNAHYKADASDIAAEARKHTSNVVTLFTPNATWPEVKAAAQGASVFVYLGHGNGWPSIYPPFQTVTKDGLGLDPSSGRRRRQARLLRRGLHPEQHPPGAERGRAAVPPVLRVGEHRARAVAGHVRRGPGAGRQLRRRVHRRGRAGGDRRGPSRPSGDQRHPPAVHDQPDDRPGLPQRADLARPPPGAVSRRSARPASRTRWTRTPRRRRASTARSSATSALRASEVTGATAVADRREPGGLRGARRRRGRRGGRRRAVRLAGEGAGPVGDRRHHVRRRDAAAPRPPRRRPRPTARGSSRRPSSAPRPAGYVRATGLAPRDSAPDRRLVAGSERRRCCRRTATAPTTSSSSPPGSPSGSPPRSRSRTPRATTVKSQSVDGDIVRFAWDLDNDAGNTVKDGAYTWTLRAKDDWGNAGTSASGGFTLDATPPESDRQPAFDGRPRRLERLAGRRRRSARRTRCPASGRSATGSRAAP